MPLIPRGIAVFWLMTHWDWDSLSFRLFGCRPNQRQYQCSGWLPRCNLGFDDWRTDDSGMPQRHLVSGRLIDVAPTAVPAYPDATVGLRSFATHVGADPDDVIRDAFAGVELRRYYERTDIASLPAGLVTVTAGGGGGGGVASTAQRSYEPTPETMRIQAAVTRRKVKMDADRAPSIDMLRKRLAHRKRRMDVEDRGGSLVETRSMPGADVDRFGDPARRDSHGNAID
jgi:hypothetical protein